MRPELALFDQDMTRILNCLRDGPKTSNEIANTLRLTINRTNRLLLELTNKQAIHASRCTISARGSNINIWELKTPKDESA